MSLKKQNNSAGSPVERTSEKRNVFKFKDLGALVLGIVNVTFSSEISFGHSTRFQFFMEFEL